MIKEEELKIHTYNISHEFGYGYCISREKKGFECEREPLFRDCGFHSTSHAKMHAENKFKDILNNPEAYDVH